MPEGNAGRGPDLTRQTLSGMKWTYLSTSASAVLQLAVTAVLARLLTPEAFGLVALADLTLRFVTYLARGGMTQAIVQRPQLEPIHIRAGATASIAFGGVFAATVWMLAPVAAAVLGDPDVVPVLRWMSLSLFLHGMGATAEGLLSRELRFRTLAIRNVVSYIIGYPVVGLILAARGAGVWALVAATLVQTGSRSVLAYAAQRHDVRPTFNRRAHADLLSFGGRVSIISFFEFLGSELDTFAVGRFAGAAPLGLYNRAYVLVRVPVYNLTTSFSQVLFPAFSSVQHEVKRFAGAYVSAARVTAAVVFPTAAGIAVAGSELVQVLLGPQWTDAIPVLPWIALASALSMVTHLAALAAEARAELNTKLAISVAQVGVFGSLLLLAAGGPLWGYGAALAGATAFALGAYLRLVSRTLDLRRSQALDGYVPALVAAATTAGAIALVRWGLLAVDVPLVVVLLGEMGTGAVLVLLHIRFGALRTVRRDLVLRLASAGLFVAGRRGPLAAILSTMLGPPSETTTAVPDQGPPSM